MRYDFMIYVDFNFPFLHRGAKKMKSWVGWVSINGAVNENTL
jgi:hypothetical protein